MGWGGIGLNVKSLDYDGLCFHFAAGIVGDVRGETKVE